MKDESKPRLTRLTAILTQLQSKNGVTVHELARQYKVSVRTIYRDIRTLEESGIPLVAEEGKGYALMQGYHLPPIMFSEAEANALVTAGQLVSQNKDDSLVKNYQQAIIKIKAVMRESQKEKAQLLKERIQVRANPSNEKTSDYLVTLQSAIVNFQLVEIHYHSLQNEITVRKIEPFAIYITQGNWVMIAFCRLRNDFRAYRLDCIQSLRVLSSHFEPHPMTLQEYFDQCRKKYLPSCDIPLSQVASTFGSSSNQIKIKMEQNTQNTINQETTVIEPFNVIGITVKTTNANNQGAKDIEALWQRFMTEAIVQQIPNKVKEEVYSIYTDYEGDYTQPYTVLLGCPVANLEEVPTGMTGKAFAGGTYQKFTAKGNLREGIVVQEWMKIWSMDIPRAYTADFEVFGEKTKNPTDAEVDIFIAIKS